MPLITRTEEMLLLVVCKLQDDAFGLTIREEVEAITALTGDTPLLYLHAARERQRGLAFQRPLSSGNQT